MEYRTPTATPTTKSPTTRYAAKVWNLSLVQWAVFCRPVPILSTNKSPLSAPCWVMRIACCVKLIAAWVAWLAGLPPVPLLPWAPRWDPQALRWRRCGAGGRRCPSRRTLPPPPPRSTGPRRPPTLLRVRPPSECVTTHTERAALRSGIRPLVRHLGAPAEVECREPSRGLLWGD
jgi:hypothetical protein